MPDHRSGVVAILGPPNAGKSTLLNYLLDEKLAIVTDKPQTTRSKILGILTLENAQLLLLDTPGFHETQKAFNRFLNSLTETAINDCDVALLLVDATRGWGSVHTEWCRRLNELAARVVVVATKCDRSDAAAPWPPSSLTGDISTLRIAARTGAGVDALVKTLVAHLPLGPRYYEEGEFTNRSLRFLVAEQIREVAFECLSQELPYALAVEVDNFDDSRADLVSIWANLLVERPSQRAIVLGKNGRMVKRIGIEARLRIEQLVENRVYLKLWVKLEPRWAKSRRRLLALGYY